MSEPAEQAPVETLESATALLERYAVLEGQLAHIQGIRTTLISKANSAADASSKPVLDEIEVIRGKLAPWWASAAAELTKGKRKSIELGGCEIGTRQGKAKLGTAEDLEPVIKSLQRREWAKPLLVTTVSIDMAAVLKSVDGVYKRQLAELGFSRIAGVSAFFVKRTKQGGTMAGAAA